MPKAKKESKAKKVLNWFKPTSFGKGALLFAIVFAVIGGSYAAFKSFAATPFSHTYTQITNGGGASLISDTETKYQVKAWNIPTIDSSVVTNFSISAPANATSYTPCVTVKRPTATGSDVDIQFSVSKLVGTGASDDIAVSQSDNYVSYCSDGSLPFAPGEKGNVAVSISNKTGGNLYVAEIYLGYK